MWGEQGGCAWGASCLVCLAIAGGAGTRCAGRPSKLESQRGQEAVVLCAVGSDWPRGVPGVCGRREETSSWRAEFTEQWMYYRCQCQHAPSPPPPEAE